MIELSALVRTGMTNRITRIYSTGWDQNIGAWREEVEEVFEEFCRHSGDDPAACQLVGEAKWVWLRFSGSGRAMINEQEFRGAEKATMIRVHRKRGKRSAL